jgi:hypothetical protein
MIQFYLLAILCNAAGGYMLLRREPPDSPGPEQGPSPAWKADTVRLVLGILSLITALFKVLSPLEGDVPILGDLIPALCGFACGATLTLGYYRKHSTTPPEASAGLAALEQVLVGHKRVVGCLAWGSAVLHFLFPQALLI